MERESTKHGPMQDDQLKHETDAMERGAPQRPHSEEWREVEPAGDVPAGRAELADSRDEEIELRSELARLLTQDDFPARRDDLVARLEDADAHAALIGRVAGLAGDQSFANAHEVMVALGINALENREP
jgi:hypothetical protein